MDLTMYFLNRAGWGVVGFVLSLHCGVAAADVVAVVSAKSAPILISKNQLMNIFLGNASIVLNGEPAIPIDQMEGSAVRDAFYAKFAGKSPAQIKAHWSKIIFTGRGQPPKEVTNSIEVKKRLIAIPNAIGYIEQDMVDGSVRVLQLE